MATFPCCASLYFVFTIACRRFFPALAGPLPPQVLSLLLLCYQNLYKNRLAGLVQYVD